MDVVLKMTLTVCSEEELASHIDTLFKARNDTHEIVYFKQLCDVCDVLRVRNKMQTRPKSDDEMVEVTEGFLCRMLPEHYTLDDNGILKSNKGFSH